MTWHRHQSGGDGASLARAFLSSLMLPWWERHVFYELTKRDVLARYRGSSIGILWSILQPLLMLGIYTFVFGVVFQARWPGLATNQLGGLQFAAVLFTGLLVHGLFADCLVQAPHLIAGNPNFVKKLVFPLEILPWTMVAGAFFRLAVGLVLLLLIAVPAFGALPATAILVPVVLLPLVVISVGVGWLLAAIGVFVRDVTQITGVLATVLLFMSPVFFPSTAAPEAIRPFLVLNPITIPVEALRDVLLWGQQPDWMALAIHGIASWAFASSSLYVFARLRRAFADVL